MQKIKNTSFLILALFILLPSIADAQRWKRFRRQLTGGIGVTNFLGELGGGEDIGRAGPWDLDLAATRPSLTIGYRYQINSYFFLRSNLTWGILKGSDENAGDEARLGRNLSFRSAFADVNVMGEFYFIQNARGNLYRSRGVRGRNGLSLDIYAFAGIGLMYFNPKAEYNGQWVALQPLGTEGQGLPGQPVKYSRFTINVPYGIGIGKTIDRYWSFNVELIIRQTFSDYIDDVSGNYYGRENLRRDMSANGASAADIERAVALSDPNIYHTLDGYSYDSQPDMGATGEVRGNPDNNDSFMTGMVTLSRKIVKRRRSRSKF